MPFAGDYLPPPSPGEVQPFSLDFSPQLVGGDTIVTVSARLEAYEGSDPNAGSAATGAPIVSGSLISQWIGAPLPDGLQPGVIYRLTMTAHTSQGKTLVNHAHLACKATE